ncbi:MAG: hypothetical protein IPN79_18255 [Saprospiraceae bacterium]|nr:hypothetical protein [Saprospiraceae bacterium]
MTYRLVIFCLSLTFFFSCSTESNNEKWHLIQYYGTIAGITQNFDRDICVWTIADSTLSIDMKKEDPFMKSMTSKHRYTTFQGVRYWEVDGLGSFIRSESGDTMYLKAPCCDMIDYTLVKE